MNKLMMLTVFAFASIPVGNCFGSEAKKNPHFSLSIDLNNINNSDGTFHDVNIPFFNITDVNGNRRSLTPQAILDAVNKKSGDNIGPIIIGGSVGLSLIVCAMAWGVWLTKDEPKQN